MLGQIGSLELIIVIIVILIVLGPKQIPIVLRKAGKIYRELHLLKKSLLDQIDRLDDDQENDNRTGKGKENSNKKIDNNEGKPK